MEKTRWGWLILVIVILFLLLGFVLVVLHSTTSSLIFLKERVDILERRIDTLLLRSEGVKIEEIQKKEKQDTVATLWIPGGISEYWAKVFLDRLTKLNNDTSVKLIRIFIFSQGGRVDAALAIVDAITSSKKKIVTIAVGEVCSAAAFILSSGHIVYATPNSSIMLHLPYYILQGRYTLDDLKSRIENLEKSKKRILELLSKKTGKPIKQLEKDLRQDKWFTAKEAIEYGIVDSLWRESIDFSY